MVPWVSAAIAIARGRRRHQRRRFLGRQRPHAGAFERHETGEEAVEPGALLGRERRAFGNDLGDRRAWRDGHWTASAMALSAAISCRRVKARNVSEADVRFARKALSSRSHVAGASSAFTSL